MSFAEAVKTGFSKYATFDGRAKRSEFWWWYLFETLAVLVFMLPAALFISLSAGNGSEANGAPLAIGIILYVIGGLVALALLVPTYAVGCRRLHDRGQSGWLQLLILVPCGNIALIVLWALEGTPTDNAYGPAST